MKVDENNKKTARDIVNNFGCVYNMERKLRGGDNMLEGFERVPVLKGRTFMSVTNDGINFNKNVVAHMGKSPYVIFLLNIAEKKAAIQKCDSSDPDALVFYQKPRNETSGVRINLRDVQQKIADMMEWNLTEYNYRVDGAYSQEDSAMIFDLNCARKFDRRNKDNANS